jgi:hypothetical protein
MTVVLLAHVALDEGRTTPGHRLFTPLTPSQIGVQCSLRQLTVGQQFTVALTVNVTAAPPPGPIRSPTNSPPCPM